MHQNMMIRLKKKKEKNEFRFLFARASLNTSRVRTSFFFRLLAGVIIFVISVLRPRDVATFAAADSVLCILF